MNQNAPPASPSAPIPVAAALELQQFNKTPPGGLKSSQKFIPDPKKILHDPSTPRPLDPGCYDNHSPVKIGTLKRGPTPKWNPLGLAEELARYRSLVYVPILKEFTSTIGITYDYLIDLSDKCSELALQIKITLERKEVALEKGALSGQLNPTFAIFSAKQLGWKDRVDHGVIFEVDPKKKDVIDRLFDSASRRLEGRPGEILLPAPEGPQSGEALPPSPRCVTP